MKRGTRPLLGLLPVLFVLQAAGQAGAWWGTGHDVLTRAAVRSLPEALPQFLRAGEETVAHLSQDPDLFKNRAVPHLTAAENPEHYFDPELLAGRPFPDTRAAFYDTCAALDLNPTQVGTLPYAVAEWTERLTMGLAEHRRWPDHPAIQQKCLVFAGLLAHYAQDLCQPLHVTLHFDGRPRPDGSVEAKGIHEHVDALVERLGLEPDQLVAGQAVPPLPPPLPALLPAIRAEIDSSRARIDAVYALADQLAAASAAPVAALGTERARAAVRFTAALYALAWETSAAVVLPDWHRR